MATLVLSTVGTLLGGSVGGAIGSLVGQSIDQQIFGSPRRGPRLGDLSVQTSSYGTQIGSRPFPLRLEGRTWTWKPGPPLRKFLRRFDSTDLSTPKKLNSVKWFSFWPI